MSRLFSSQLLAVEQRMLFDGALALAAEAVTDRPKDSSRDVLNSQRDVNRDIANRAGQLGSTAAPRTLIVIDTTVANWQQIADAASPQVNLLLLDANQDGLAQIASAMLGQKYDAVHIVSHGTEGRLQLGTRAISAANIDQYSADLARIGEGLTDSGDLLLYGCDISSGAAGARFLQALARATGADIAASINDTGAASKGGDWVLESSTGVIEAVTAFDAARLSVYSDTLAAVPAVTLGTAVTTGGGASNTVLLGEQFTMTASFDNTDAAASGFGPYIDVFYAARGVDGGASPDGISFTGANYLGASLTTTFITLTATDITNGTVNHPYYRDSSGASLVAIPTGQGLVAGDKLMVVQLPFGSVTAGQPAAAISLTGLLSSGADLGTGLKEIGRAHV